MLKILFQGDSLTDCGRESEDEYAGKTEVVN